MALRAFVLTLAVLLGAVAAGCGGDDGPATVTVAADTTAPADATRVYRAVEPSVVAVLVESTQGDGEGSGVVWSADKVVTNHHVVDGARSVRVGLASGERLAATVVASDPLTDLAVLDVERTDLPPVEVADRLPAVGTTAYALGNPLGFENSLTAGVVSGIDRSVPSGGRTPALVGLLQTDAAISPGNSGGALVDAQGRLIGVNVAYIPPQARAVSIGFAIPATTVRPVVRELLREGRVEHAYVGLQLRPLTDAITEHLDVDVREGAVVAAVEEDGPAAAAGVRAGDVIVALGDRPVRAVEDVFALLRSRRPGQVVGITVVRDGRRVPEAVRLGTRPRR